MLSAEITSSQIKLCDEDGDGASLLMFQQHPLSQVTLWNVGLNVSKETQSNKEAQDSSQYL